MIKDSRDNKDTANLLNAYMESGFTVARIFEKADLDEFAATFQGLLEMQMRKLNLPATSDLQKDVVALNMRSSVALSECLVMARNTSAGHRLAANRNLDSISNLLLSGGSGRVKRPLIISGPSFFVNIPDNNERKYTWHSEQNWYPKRRNFLNVWCPIISDRVNDDSMAVMAASHDKEWFYFSEYTGYDGKIDDSANVQYEIPAAFLNAYKSEIPPVEAGEGLFFNGKIVHRSLDNVSKNTLFTIVFRAFDYSEDLTLSSNWADIPYNRKSISVPEINVAP